MTAAPGICALCGGPPTEAVYSCTSRPDALTRGEAYDHLVLADLAALDEPLPERCPDCAAGIEGTHHHGCTLAVCAVHDTRADCGCDDRALAERDRADRRAERRRDPRLARRWTRPRPFARGEEILRSSPDRDPASQQ